MSARRGGAAPAGAGREWTAARTGLWSAGWVAALIAGAAIQGAECWAVAGLGFIALSFAHA